MEFLVNLLDNFKHLFSDHVVFSVGILLFAGYFAGRLAEKLRLPSITGYIIAGLIMGDSVLGMIHEDIAPRLDSITEIALGLIAITIGAEFDISRLKRTGTKVLIITFFQATFSFVFVIICLSIMGLSMSYVLILGAIATATAPAATVIIVKELRARGEFVDYLYGVVAFDDALCVILFSIIFAVVGPVIAGTGVVGGGDLLPGFYHALGEIFLSCIIGFSGGYIIHVLTKQKYKLNEILIISLAVIFLTTSVSIVLGFSLLIANMALGATLVNLSAKNRRVFRVIEPITPPIFALFFVLAGTELSLSVFSKGFVVMCGSVYLVSRFAGKYAGTYLSAALCKVPDNIKKYLGFCLFPQAGVAIGLVLFVQTSPVLASAPSEVKEMLVVIVNIVLLSIFVNELIGPVIAKYGIKKGMDL